MLSPAGTKILLVLQKTSASLVNKIDQAKANEVIAKRFQGKKPGTIVRNFLTPVLHHAAKQGWCDIPNPSPGQNSKTLGTVGRGTRKPIESSKIQHRMSAPYSCS
jgi:hypothetical protein